MGREGVSIEDGLRRQRRKQRLARSVDLGPQEQKAPKWQETSL